MVKIVGILCGLPGAGKSFFARMFKEYIEMETTSGKNMSVAIVHFDAFEEDKEQWDAESYHRSRETSIKYLSQLLSEDEIDRNELKIILVDDNMSMHSMRRQIYSLSRDYRVATVILWVDVPPAVALERNSSRPDSVRVSEASWNAEYERFEAPNSKYIADRSWLRIDGSNESGLTTGLQSAIRLIEEKMNSENFVCAPENVSKDCKDQSLQSRFLQLGEMKFKKIVADIIAQFRQLIADESIVTNMDPNFVKTIASSLSAILANQKKLNFNHFRTEIKDLQHASIGNFGSSSSDPFGDNSFAVMSVGDEAETMEHVLNEAIDQFIEGAIAELITVLDIPENGDYYVRKFQESLVEILKDAKL